ncbi:probable WRKY transcription factor 69 [Punica granatum]|uniref:WRKY domain-containing protein n=2 Tax=Punica granatum TaxID=22663 RepID=A0A218VR80_PUNGR|nr:probable WRKY transcription factor 69 [Punica granatum]OWM62853.1 hypothetical protein CDL15_Pgr020147 [Punica granatum]PKI48193.1 hypothetical protein CRG98_031458 [Punica granatum]
MEASLSTTMNEDAAAADELKPQTPPAKKRKVVEKTVVRVRIGNREKNEGPPSDSWSWRKYGQKPIKGSPYPRGYYRCSTAKGCSAKKQVERCKSDASVLVVTYTTSHNHPERLGCNPRKPKQAGQQLQKSPSGREPEESSSQDQEAQQGTYRPAMEAEEFHYSQYLQEGGGELFTLCQLDTTGNNVSSGLVLLEEESGHVRVPSSTDSLTATTLGPARSELEEDEYYGFFDELEELYPTVSLFSREGYHGRHHQQQLVR